MFKNVKILSWLVVILLATNLATIGTVFYRTNRINNPVGNVDTELPLEQRSRFFNRQLELSNNQMESFRNFNREYNRRTAEINMQLQKLREEIVDELVKEDSDIEKLNQLSAEVGELHKQLKLTTNDLYLELKEISDSTQRERLAIVFRALLEGDPEIRNNRRMGGRWQMNRP